MMKSNVKWLAMVPLLALAAGAGEGPKPQVCRFTTDDGVQIVGDYYPPAGSGRAPAVVLLHMYRSDRGAWRPLVPKLHEAGFAVLAIDMRGHGESVLPEARHLHQRMMQRDPVLFNKMWWDVAAAYAWLAQQPRVDLAQFGLVGASVGCSIALDYASRDKSVDAVVCMTPGTNYLGVDSVTNIQAIGPRPILLLASEGERQASDALHQANPAAKVEVVGPGVVHGTHMFGKIAGVDERIIKFLKKYVCRAGERPVVAEFGTNEYFAVGSARDLKLKPDQRRLFSSVAEARARGLYGPDSAMDGTMVDTPGHPKDAPVSPRKPRP